MRIIQKYLSPLFILLFGMLSQMAFANKNSSQIINSQVLNSAPGFELKSVTSVDDSGVSRTVELYYIHGYQGIQNAYQYGGLPLEEKLELEQEIDDWGGDWSTSSKDQGQLKSDTSPFTWIIDKRAVLLQNDVDAQAYIDEFDMQEVVDEEALYPEGDNLKELLDSTSQDPQEQLRLFGCKGWRSKSKGFNKSLNENLNHNKRFGKDNAYIDFEGQLSIKGRANLNVSYEYKRNWICIPYKFKFKHFDAKSDYDVNGDFKLTGVAKHNFGNFNWEIAKPKVLDTIFFVGPIPVRIAIKIPIEVGTGDIQVQATGQIGLTKPLHFKGNFDYKCSLSNCTKRSSNHQNLSGDVLNNIGASISASINLAPYVQVGVRPIIYGEWFLYAQVGIKPSFPIEVYGYYGNLCGDGDNNGSNETVSAILGTIDFEAGITGHAKAFNSYILRPKYWKIWETPIVFIDFLRPGSSAMTPLLRPVVNDKSVSLPVSIRSCVNRFTNRYPVDYRVYWGDGFEQSLNDVKTQKTLTHTFSSAGIYNLRVVYKNGVETRIPVTIEDDDDWGGDW